MYISEQLLHFKSCSSKHKYLRSNNTRLENPFSVASESLPFPLAHTFLYYLFLLISLLKESSLSILEHQLKLPFLGNQRIRVHKVPVSRGHLSQLFMIYIDLSLWGVRFFTYRDLCLHEIQYPHTLELVTDLKKCVSAL